MSEKTPAIPSEMSLRPSRRSAIQWVMASVAASALPSQIFGEPVGPTAPEGRGVPTTGSAAIGKGYGSDPDLRKVYQPGDLWPLTLTDSRRNTATALADVILPKDHLGPAASEVGVIGMVDEWISAPYPSQQEDRPVILTGLAWIETESGKRFGKGFPELTLEQKQAICDDICFREAAKPEFKKGAEFFSRFRSLCASAYYATPAGWEAIGYVGNLPSDHFDGPPPAVLEKLGVTQTVK